MLGQGKKDNSLASQKPNSLLLKRVPSVKAPVVDYLTGREIKPTFALTEGVMSCCDFTVSETGCYHVAAQITIKNKSDISALTEYLQFGVCKKDMSDHHNLLRSIILNNNCQPEYVITDTICSIIKLTKDEPYNLWLNFGCDNVDAFEFQSEFSNLNLYKL